MIEWIDDRTVRVTGRYAGDVAKAFEREFEPKVTREGRTMWLVKFGEDVDKRQVETRMRFVFGRIVDLLVRDMLNVWNELCETVPLTKYSPTGTICRMYKWMSFVTETMKRGYEEMWDNCRQCEDVWVCGRCGAQEVREQLWEDLKVKWKGSVNEVLSRYEEEDR